MFNLKQVINMFHRYAKKILFTGLLLLSGLASIAQNIAKIEKYIEQARKDWNVTGMSVAIVKDGQVISAKGYGILEEGKPDKVNENTLFAIASNSKAFVASSIATLVTENKISWNDKVKYHLPYFELYDHYATSEANIKDLLCHRLGLGTYSGDFIWYKSDLSPEEVIKRAKYVPKAFDFRDGYGYSNLMFIAAGEVIRSVTGKSWADYVHQKFLTPLGMNRTVTSIKELRSKGNFATPHKPEDQKNKPIAWANWDNMGAAGGIISSAKDMAQWLRFNLNSGIWKSDTLLHPDMQNMLWTPHNNFVITKSSLQEVPGRHFAGYGLGWSTYDYYGRKIITHGGAYDGMYSKVALVPDENLGIVILTNNMKNISTPLAYQIINTFIKEDMRDWSKQYLDEAKNAKDDRIANIKKARVNGTRPTLSLEKCAGVYHADMYGEISIKKVGSDLKLNFAHSPQLSATLKHWHYDTWEILWDEPHAWFGFGTVKFKTDHSLKIKGMDIDVPNYDIFFHELNIKKKTKSTHTSSGT